MGERSAEMLSELTALRSAHSTLCEVAARSVPEALRPNYGLQPTGPVVECVGFLARHQVFASRRLEPVWPASPQLNPGVRRPDAGTDI